MKLRFWRVYPSRLEIFSSSRYWFLSLKWFYQGPNLTPLCGWWTSWWSKLISKSDDWDFDTRLRLYSEQQFPSFWIRWHTKTYGIYFSLTQLCFEWQWKESGNYWCQSCNGNLQSNHSANHACRPKLIRACVEWFQIVHLDSAGTKCLPSSPFINRWNDPR